MHYGYAKIWLNAARISEGTTDGVETSAHEIGHFIGLAHVEGEGTENILMHRWHDTRTATGPTTSDINGARVILGLHTNSDHVFGSYTRISSSQHEKVCSGCGGYLEEDHKYDGGCTGTVCIYCGNTRTASSHNYVWKKSDTFHWQECTKCESQINVQNHDYGTNGKCTLSNCNFLHSDSGHTNYTWKKSDLKHWQECFHTLCNYATTETTHTYNTGGTCTACKHVHSSSHTVTWVTTTTSHQPKCTTANCTYAGTSSLHSYLTGSSQCATCGYIKSHTHDFSGQYAQDGISGHKRKCTKCDQYSATTAHTWNGNTCVCGYTHTHTGAWTKTSTQHTRTCTTSGCGYVDTGAHVWNVNICTTCTYSHSSHSYTSSVYKSNGDSGHFRKCSTCDLYSTTVSTHSYNGTATTCSASGCGYTHPSNSTHKVSSSWTTDGTSHWKECAASNCVFKFNSENHSPDSQWTKTATEHYKLCSKCSYKTSQGSHSPSTGTCSSCGYTGSHTHTYLDWTKTDTTHYKKCKDCTTTSQSGSHGYVVSSDGCANICSTCSYNHTDSKHSIMTIWAVYDGSRHYKKCTTEGCNYYNNLTSHTGTWNTNSTTHYRNCELCGYAQSGSHSPSTGYCSTCNYYSGGSSHTSHTYGSWSSNGSSEHIRYCSCGNSQTESHNFPSSWTQGDFYHTKYCSTCGYTLSGAHTFSGGSVTCTVCGKKGNGITVIPKDEEES